MQGVLVGRFLVWQLNRAGKKGASLKCSKEVHSLNRVQSRQGLYYSVRPFTGSSRSSSTNASSGGLAGYWRSLKWVPIPLSVGFAYICYQQYGHIKKRENRHIRGSVSIEDSLAKDWQVGMRIKGDPTFD